MRLKHLFIFACIGVILFIGGCSDKKKEAEEKAPKAAVEDMFNFIPAHSPYVIGNVTPLPEPYLKKMITVWQKLAPFQAGQLERLTAQAPEIFDNQLGKIYIDLTRALLAEMETIKTPEDLRSQWGVSPETSGVLYGMGLLPAFRVQIEEKQKVEQLLTRLEEKSGQKMSTAEFNGQSYRYIEIKKKIHLKAVLSVTDKYFIAGIIPGKPSDFDQFLPLLLGTGKPEDPLSQSGFTKKISQYHFPGYGDGYFDIRNIAAVLRGEGEGLNRLSYQALIPRPDYKLQIGCNVEFNRTLFEKMPRMVFGISKLTDTVFDMEMVLELGTGLVDILKKLPRSMPDIASTRDPMFAMGIGANIPELRRAITQLLQFIIDNNQDCPAMNTDQLKAAIPKLNMALSPMISGFHAIVLSLDQLEFGENGQPVMDTIRACIAADMIDPQGILAMAGSFVPSLAKADIGNNGIPAAILLEDLPIKLPGLFVAIKDQRLVLALGEEANPRAKTAVNAKGLSDMPFYWMKYQTRAWEQLIKSGLSANPEIEKNDQERVLEIFEQYKDLFKSVAGGIYVTNNGVSFRESVVFE